MQKILLALAGFCIASGVARAQSRGRFSYGTGNTGTTGSVLMSNGSISGGQQCSVSSLGNTDFTCSTNTDCTNIFGSNSGATCNAGLCQLPPSAGDCIGTAKAGLKTNSGSGNVFDIRPSAV